MVVGQRRVHLPLSGYGDPELSFSSFAHLCNAARENQSAKSTGKYLRIVDGEIKYENASGIFGFLKRFFLRNQFDLRNIAIFLSRKEVCTDGDPLRVKDAQQIIDWINGKVAKHNQLPSNRYQQIRYESLRILDKAPSDVQLREEAVFRKLVGGLNEAAFFRRIGGKFYLPPPFLERGEEGRVRAEDVPREGAPLKPLSGKDQAIVNTLHQENKAQLEGDEQIEGR